MRLQTYQVSQSNHTTSRKIINPILAMIEHTLKPEQAQVDAVSLPPEKVVSLLSFDLEEHRMHPKIDVHYTHIMTDTTKEIPAEQEATVALSEQWMEDYRAWNTFAKVEGAPVFDSLEELRAFNEKGAELAKRLQLELEDQNTIVAPFKPLYSNVAVGDAVCAWWHVKDMNYGVVIPIQKLPISDNLKSRFQCWRFRKLTGWLDPEIRDELNLEGRDLEEHLLWELNVTVEDERELDFSLPCSVKLSFKELADDKAIIIYKEDRENPLNKYLPQKGVCDH